MSEEEMSHQKMTENTADNTGHNQHFQVDMNIIPEAVLKDEDEVLQGLALDVFNQEELEQGVIQQVTQAIEKEEEERRRSILKKEQKNINDEIKNIKHELADLATQLAQLGQGKSLMSEGANRRLDSARRRKEIKLGQLKTLEARKKAVQAKIEGRLPVSEEDCRDILSLGPSIDTDRDIMIKKGDMTPFGTVVSQAEALAMEQTSFQGADAGKNKDITGASNKKDEKDRTNVPETSVKETNYKSKEIEDIDLQDLELQHDIHSNNDAEWLPSDKELWSRSESEFPVGSEEKSKGVKKKKLLKREALLSTHKRPLYHSSSEEEESDEDKSARGVVMRKHRDDGNEEYYDERMEKFQHSEREKQKLRELGHLSESDDDEEFDGGLKIPARIWSKLYKYQKTCVKWLWELHCQEAGGIVGDEMGLGKTIQAIAFLASLRYSKLRNSNFQHPGLGACVVVCPTTVMHQWVKEFHTWWPPFRVAILHSSGTYTGKERELVRHIVKNSGILVTSYTTLVLQQDNILPFSWHYVILDEGHKIRNPDVQATLVCKQFRTPHRIILSGSPIQNNLKELWSLMDFVFPGKLGTLPDFMQHFAVPILQGGYANASPVQVQTAYKCACVLRDTINPYLLRRMKADVKTNLNLPAKNEQVLFCRLTDEQKEVYQEYLESRECQAIMRGDFMVFAGLITLRKICNHPDLSTGGPRVFRGEKTDGDPAMEYGYWKRAGKMIVVEALLRLWKKQDHRVLLFTQSKQMLDIMEAFVQEKDYSYVRMDGGTAISARQPLVQKYNNDSTIYLFLLTTRVGGLGINLVGANRIVIYDPDWNPSTDTQARERAWRIGQKRQVTIYRLLTTGTIEEKIYHRQIFKQFLTNRVLKDPKQRRLFKTNEMHELFSLGRSDDKGETETSAIFAGTGSSVSVDMKKINRFDRMKAGRKKPETEEEEQEEERKDAELNFNAKEIQQMRDLAKNLSQKIGQGLLSVKLREPKTSEDSGSDKKELKYKQGKNSESENRSDLENKSFHAGIGCAGLDDMTKKENTSKGFKFGKVKRKDLLDQTCIDDPFSVDLTPGVSGNTSMRQKEKKECPPFLTSMKGGAGKRRSNNNDEPQKKYRRKKHKKKDARFEGELIPNLDKQRHYKPGRQETSEKEEQQLQDDYVLHRLFKKTGIQGALKHDKIMEPGSQDYVIVENEAEKVAREASSALKRSRSLCLPATSGIPSWTGQHGGVKRRFGQKKNTVISASEKAESETNNQSTDNKSSHLAKHFDGSLAGSVHTNLDSGDRLSSAVSSRDLLGKMRVRNKFFTKASDQDEDNDELCSDETSVKLIQRLREFIMFECKKLGQATTKEVLDEFKTKLPASDSAKFRAMLHSICTFDKISGTWKLKNEFK